MHLVNLHLDKCMAGETGKRSKKTVDQSCPSSSPSSSNNDVGREPIQDSNAFVTMMKQSKHRSRSICQRFHLCSDFTLSWVNQKDGFATDKIVEWSSKVQLKNFDDSRTLLILSTSIPEHRSPVRLVTHHSSLPVPVLKSILQKSIRRRRPLPSTRVAMELMDKALGPLLRRLSIIMFEDSMLHPDLPLLCWLMAAESKGYKIPQELLSRVLGVVFEVCTCPWTDRGNKTVVDDTTVDFIDVYGPESAVILKSIAMRISYGGMECDMEMLRQSLVTWRCRLRSGSIPEEVRQRLGPSSPIHWIDLPEFIHSKMRHCRIHLIEKLMKERLLRLTIWDLSLEGVDFHCSNVLDHFIENKAFVSACTDRLNQDPLLELKQSGDLKTILERCIWQNSSGVNFRQPLLDDAVASDEQSKLKSLWQDLVSNPFVEFTTQYVTARLAVSIP